MTHSRGKTGTFGVLQVSKHRMACCYGECLLLHKQPIKELVKTGTAVDAHHLLSFLARVFGCLQTSSFTFLAKKW